MRGRSALLVALGAAVGASAGMHYAGRIVAASGVLEDAAAEQRRRAAGMPSLEEWLTCKSASAGSYTPSNRLRRFQPQVDEILARRAGPQPPGRPLSPPGGG